MKKKQYINSIFIFTIIIFIVLNFYYCDQQKRKIRFATGPVGSTHQVVGKEIIKIWQEDFPQYEFIEDTSRGGSTGNCKALEKEEVEFALSQNYDVAPDIGKGLKTVMPVYKQILFIIYYDTIKANTLAELVKGRKVGVGPKGAGTSRLVNELFNAFGVDSQDYIPVHNSWNKNYVSPELPIVCWVTGFSNPAIQEMLFRHHGKLWSLDNHNYMGKGSAADGFALNNPLCIPYMIPRNCYHGLPLEPIVTISNNNVLLTNHNVPDQLVYDLTESIFNNRENLAQANILLRGLTEDYGQIPFRFGLHKGSKMYINRDEPTFAERYAEVIGLGITLIGILYAAFSGMYQWSQRRKKNRIDDYYEKILAIESKIRQTNSAFDCQKYREDLLEIRADAYKKLIKEEIEANESFMIFTHMLEKTIEESIRKAQFIQQASV